MISLIALGHAFRKVNPGYQFGKGQYRKINNFFFMVNSKLYGNNKKEAETFTNTVSIFLKDIALIFGIGKCTLIITGAGKLVSNGGMEL